MSPTYCMHALSAFPQCNISYCPYKQYEPITDAGFHRPNTSEEPTCEWLLTWRWC